MKGKLLGKRYEIMDKIDSGGMADIYRASCKKTDEIVAVKVLKEKFSENAEYIDRFKREAEVVFSLDHKNIVHVTDIGNEDGIYYIVMEFIEGSTLKTLIEKKTYINEDAAVRYAIQICSALSYAHKKGIIHRDIKPQNILIDKSGNVKLTDFGIAKSISSKQEQAKQVIGSVYYISPEQARGETIDESTDIYSLGIVLYEMLTGILPHTGGKTVSVALKHINEQITPPRDIKGSISKAINCIVLKATSKNKEDRFKSMAEFKEDLILSIADPEGSFIDMPADYKNTDAKAGIKKKNFVWKFGILILLTAVIVTLIIMGIMLLNNSDKKTVLVPPLAGLSLQDAEKQVGNLNVTTTYEPSGTAQAGTIISQSPAAGSYAAVGDAITLTVSGGPDQLVMPDFVGMALEDVKAQIKSMGLTINDSDIIYEYHQDVPMGNVISQIPEAGSAVTKTDILSLVISGESTVDSAIMPQLSNKQLNEAIGLLYSTGFKNILVYDEDSEQNEGTVIRQSPEKGIQTPNTDEIDLWISRYKDQSFSGRLNTVLEIPEKESKITVVLQEPVNDYIVNFVIQEKNHQDAGELPLDVPIKSRSGGNKRVVVYVNNIEKYSQEVDFIG